MSGGYNPAMMPGMTGFPFGGSGNGYPPNPRWLGGTGNWSRYPGRNPAASFLDGKWYGNSGEVLEIRTNRFRLSDGRHTVKGVVTINDNLLKMYTPNTKSLQIYTFVRSQTKLVLQDTSGQVLVFKQRPSGRGYPVRVF